MDIGARKIEIDPEATAWTDDIKIGGKKSGLKLLVRSADHPELMKLSHRLAGRSMREGLALKGQPAELLDEAIGRNMGNSALEQAVGVTVDWEWGADEDGDQFCFNGEIWEFSPERARELLLLLPEAQEAANAKASETANFTKR